MGKLQKMTAWRRKFRPDVLSEEDVLLQLSSGKGYLHDHLDAAGRPVMVVRVAKHFPGTCRPTSSCIRVLSLQVKAELHFVAKHSME